MNVVLCSAGELYGGVERFVDGFARRLLREADVRSSVILFHDGALYRRLKGAGVDVRLVSSRFSHDPSPLWRTARLLKQLSADVVHTHGYKANILGGLAARIAGARVVRTEHGVVEPAGVWTRFKMTLNVFLDRCLALRAADRVVFVSREMERAFPRTNGGAPRDVIPNGVEEIESSSLDTSFRSAPGLFHVGIVGRLTAVKGHAVLFKAMKIMRDLPVHLHLFGDGPLEASLRRSSVEEGLSGRVTFWGFREDVLGCMARMDVLAMPSLREGFPFVVLEAALLKVPLVASRVGGVAEMFEDGKEALLVPPSDPEALGRAILRVQGDPALRRRLAESAEEKVRGGYLMRHMARRYLDLYKDVLNHER